MILAIFPITVDPQNLEPQAKNTLVGLSRFPIKIRGKSVQGFKSYNRTFKQTNKQSYFFL